MKCNEQNKTTNVPRHQGNQTPESQEWKINQPQLSMALSKMPTKQNVNTEMKKKSTLTNICAHHLYQKEGIFWNFSKGQLAWVCSVPDTQQRRPKQYLFSQERMYYIGSHNHEIMIRQGKIPVKILSDSQFQTLNFICYSLQTW